MKVAPWKSSSPYSWPGPETSAALHRVHESRSEPGRGSAPDRRWFSPREPSFAPFLRRADPVPALPGGTPRAWVAPRVTYRASIRDRKSTRLNSSHSQISYAVFCLKKKNPGTGPALFGDDPWRQAWARRVPGDGLVTYLLPRDDADDVDSISVEEAVKGDQARLAAIAARYGVGDVLVAIARLKPFFFNDPTTTEIYTLSLHDALPI